MLTPTSTPNGYDARPATDHSGLVRSFHDIESGRLDRDSPVVVLFSGGLDSTYQLHRLASAGFADIHAVYADLGAGEDISEQKHVAEQLSVHLHILDGREVFAEEYVRPAVAAQSVYLGTHPISSSLSRPLLAKLAVEQANALGATAVLHTANRSQNTMRRLNGALRLLGWTGAYGSPYDLDPVDRDQKVRELESRGLVHMSKRLTSVDSNLWCREFESGVLEDPEEHSVPEHLYRWSVLPTQSTATEIEIGFDRGVPCSIDGAELSLRVLIDTLNQRVGAFGIGRYSGLEHLQGGQKVLELREMPAAWILLRSYRHLETATLDAESIREKMHVEQIWVREALEGRWFANLRRASQSFIDTCASQVTGTVRWRLRHGTADTLSIRASHPLYLRDREGWERRATAEILD
ncbi:argininosuccinate synthase-related protein [Streptomyces caniferus]|uniref:argininosuccinate synthase n=1 Tax=Streptomyces caniferus TaxID=285557 RepID=A0A640SF63_9ACTN|nr:argininosuccinate synthase-related protein [Streptomyces caniferus]GFE08215.1 argininosuccinate synthase [Streptomyces caniferus]